MEQRPSRYRLASALVAVLMLAGACSSSGEPTGFDQQVGPIGEELADVYPDLTAETELPIVQRNFLEGCALGEPSTIADETVAARADSCTCAYDELVLFYRANATGESAEDRELDAFSAFKDLNEDLQDETGVVPANVQAILEGCES